MSTTTMMSMSKCALIIARQELCKRLYPLPSPPSTTTTTNANAVNDACFDVKKMGESFFPGKSSECCAV